MLESSQFSDTQPRFDAMEKVDRHGATCDTFRVKLYGKLHFLKQLKPEYAHEIRYQEAFRKEFETGYRLEHPRLVRYISLSADGILMEYVDGETLAERLASNPDYFKHRKNADKFLRQLLDVVGYLHTHQVLHLDLKPDNILLTRINDDVKLVDLGFCYTDTFVDTQGFTNRFAAPEQLSGGVVDARTDVYALGKVLECLPSRPKYNKVIARCTQHNPEDRYQSVADMQRALFPRKRAMLWPLMVFLAILLTGSYFVFTDKEQPSAVTSEPQVEINHEEKRETLLVEEAVHPVMQPSTSASLGPVECNISKDEDGFISQPRLRVVTSEEFIRYKQQLDEYYSDVSAFLDDTTNYQNYPSHIAYQQQYQAILQSATERIEADEWSHPLYESPMNPISSYTREYRSAIEHRAFLNGNKLP